jgi:hypothetical protein
MPALQHKAAQLSQLVPCTRTERWWVLHHVDEGDGMCWVPWQLSDCVRNGDDAHLCSRGGGWHWRWPTSPYRQELAGICQAYSLLLHLPRTGNGDDPAPANTPSIAPQQPEKGATCRRCGGASDACWEVPRLVGAERAVGSGVVWRLELWGLGVPSGQVSSAQFTMRRSKRAGGGSRAPQLLMYFSSI